MGQTVHYTLDGFDSTWQDMGSHRYVHYHNVPAGHYTFKVRIGQVTTLEKSLTVVPRWWRTGWFGELRRQAKRIATAGE